MARIVSVNVNPAGGVPKHPVAEALVTRQGVRGDHQRNRRYHGGPERAVCLFSHERILALQAEGHPIVPGASGENLTVGGLDWASLQPGDCLAIGESLRIQISSYTVPCSNIAAAFEGGAFKRISEKLHPGWSRLYARVLQEGIVRPGDPVAFDVADG
jgi:MOSC domain-containing protein YiiM